MLLHDVIMTSYCCQRYAECLVTTLFSSETVHRRDRRTTPRTGNSWTAASRNATLSCARSVAIKQLRSQSYGLRSLGCNAASCLSKTNPHRLIDVWCGLEQSIFDEAIDQWRGRHRAYYAKGVHLEYGLWTYNVDFVHICYIQCDLFECYIFNYEIMPATLANTLLFIL